MSKWLIIIAVLTILVVVSILAWYLLRTKPKAESVPVKDTTGSSEATTSPVSSEVSAETLDELVTQLEQLQRNIQSLETMIYINPTSQ